MIVALEIIVGLVVAYILIATIFSLAWIATKIAVVLVFLALVYLCFKAIAASTMR